MQSQTAIVTALTGLFFTTPAPATVPSHVIAVDDDAAAGGNGTAWGNAFTHLQDALDEADARNSDGDNTNDVTEIWVAAGTYRPDQGANQTAGDTFASFELRGGVALYGGFDGTEQTRDQRDPNPFSNGTVLSGDLNGDDDGVETIRVDNARTIVEALDSTPGAVLDGFTIEDGGRDVAASSPMGGGMRINAGDPLVANCFFQDNWGNEGGGLAVTGSRATISSTSFMENRGYWFGAGAHVEPNAEADFYDCDFGLNVVDGPGGDGGGLSIDFGFATVIDCSFLSNTAIGEGGGLYIRATESQIEGCFFANNDAWDGGAVMCAGFDDPDFENCYFRFNSASRNGGAVQVLQCNPTLVNCVFDQNTAGSNGGALNAGMAPAYVSIYNGLLHGNEAGNRGGGISTGNQGAVLFIESTTIMDNTAADEGGGLRINADSTLSMDNSIVYGNSGVGTTSQDQLHDAGGSIDVRRCNVQGGAYVGSEGNIDADPMCVDRASGNYRLQPASPCIDAGRDSYIVSDPTDLDGDGDTSETLPLDLDNHERIAGAKVDMGCYEFAATAPCIEDIDGDGMVNVADLLILLSSWGPCNCAADINGDGAVDVTDMLMVISAWGSCA